MAYVDRQRAERLMAEAGVDALVLLSPENFYYASGASPGVATMWRRAGAVAILVPAEAAIPEAAIVSDLFAESFRSSSHITDVRESAIWVESSRLDHDHLNSDPREAIASSWEGMGRSIGFDRPTTFDPMVCYRHIVDALVERGLAGSRLGFEGSAVSVNEVGGLYEAFAGFELVDASHLIAKLKMVKSEPEIENLRSAVKIAEQGICAVRDAIETGATRSQLAGEWARAVQAHPLADSLSGSWEYISVGADPWGSEATAQVGDLVKVDVGCLIDGYTSDTGRTFVLGPASDFQKRIYDALMEGFSAGSAHLRPGIQLSEVYRATLEAIRDAGFPGYTRGHFGHGLGAGLGSEEWPFISSDAETVLEPGMVMAFECPWYINGLGGMIIENQLLITEEGHEMMNGLPLDLTEIPH